MNPRNVCEYIGNVLALAALLGTVMFLTDFWGAVVAVLRVPQ